MNIKNIAYLLFFSIFFCLCKHPLETMHNTVVHKIPDLTKLIYNKQYNTITFESLYKSLYLLQALNVFISHCSDQKIANNIIDLSTKEKSALSTEIINTLLSILDKPYEHKEHGKKNMPAVIFDLLHLAVGPQPTLLDLKEVFDEEIKQNYFNAQTINTFGRYYTIFIETMYKTYMGVKNENTNTQKINTYLAKALHYAQQARQTMQKHKLPLIFDETIDQIGLIEWLTQPEQTYTHQFMKKMDVNILKKLVLGIQKIKQKTTLPKKLFTYIEFIGDIDFHAEIVTTLFECLCVHKNMADTQWTRTLKEYIRSISS